MIDKKLETNIKKVKEFMEIWNNFRGLFENSEVQNFAATKKLINTRFDDLMDSLGEGALARFTKNEPLYNILSLQDIAIMSDERRKAVDNDWEDSFKFLGRLLGRLEKKKRLIEDMSPVGFGIKKGIAKIRFR